MELPIYFISDVHLMLNDTAEERQKRKSLYRFLNYVRTTRGTLFFVGDLFDFYFEYRDMIPKAYFDFYNKAYQLKKAGVNLRFITGNLSITAFLYEVNGSSNCSHFLHIQSGDTD